MLRQEPSRLKESFSVSGEQLNIYSDLVDLSGSTCQLSGAVDFFWQYLAGFRE